MNLQFDQPAMLWIALLALPMGMLGWFTLRGHDGLRRWTTIVIRAALIATLAVVLAGPHSRREHDHLTVIGLLDVSDSVRRFAQLPSLSELAQAEETQRRSYVQYLRDWYRRATETKAPADRFGLVVFDGEAIAAVAPTTTDYIADDIDLDIAAGTSIADAIRLGLAMFPADTAKRLVLATDGNETSGDALEAARQATAGRRTVPIDVLPIVYRVTSDAQILRLEVPPSAQPGQTVTARIVTEASHPTAGRLTLRREGVAVDLNARLPGNSRHVALPAGRSVHLASVTLGQTPVNRFEAIFEPDVPSQDALADNNRAVAFTATPGKGRVLILDSRRHERENLLAQILREARLPVDVTSPEMLPHDLLSFQNFDLIVLDNVAAYELSGLQHTLLGRYVNDLGGGLIMIGGENSFGAGGWNGTTLEDVLPLELDPPREMRLPQAALVLVLDKSGSMNQHVAGARATQQEVANEAAALAIESLRAESLVGVVTFNSSADEYVSLQRNDDPQAIARKVRAITAGGGTDLHPALRKAHIMLRAVEADRKHVVCLTDGRSATGGLEAIVQEMVADHIKVSTIAVGDRADHDTLAALATLGEGKYYPVLNPKALPRVMVDSVQILNKPLLKEVPFVPVVLPTGTNLTTGMADAPRLGGLVVTAPRDDPQAVIDMTHPDGEPLLARWQAGLGRAVAFTSDLGGKWSQSWADWPTAAAFWTQLARTTARPSVSHEAELLTELKDGRLHITLEASDEQGGFIDYLQVEGTVYPPEADPMPVRLRQTAPGRYQASVPARAAGNYIVALNPRRGERQLAPVIGGASRSTGDEFRRYASNLPLLEEIAELTGGRVLDLADPTSVDLYDRADMPVSVSLLPAWRTLLLIVLAVLMLDIAARRIAWSAAAARALAARAVARVAPASARGREVAATLATLRQVTERFDDRLQSETRKVPKLQPPPAVAPPRHEQTPPPPEPSKIAAALGALLGRSKPPPPPPDDGPQPHGEGDAEQPLPENLGSTETTSSLLAAKRRLRKQIDPDD